jgi:hypothetical protein
MKRLRRLFTSAIVAVMTLLAGCVVPPMAKDGDAVKPTQGLLALRISSNVDAKLSYVDYSDVSTFGSRWTEYMTGPKGAFLVSTGEEKYIVVPMAAGEYMWSRFDFYPKFSWTQDSNPKFAWLQTTNRFRVEANTITYIGHIRISVVGSRLMLSALDREDDMRAHLESSYPAYLSGMQLRKAIAELRLR